MRHEVANGLMAEWLNGSGFQDYLTIQPFNKCQKELRIAIMNRVT